MVTVGIPRALLYYQYYPMYRTFFEALGAQVVVSSPTTSDILASGSARVVAETCLPAKIFLGHVISLAKECDAIFVPSVRSVVPKVYSCAKFLGLPDMTRAVVPEAPSILEVDIDVNTGRRELYLSIYRLGRRFTWNPTRVRRAALAAWHTHQDYRLLMSREGLTPPQAIARIYRLEDDGERHEEASATSIALIGHPYLLYDEHLNHRIIHRLEQANCKVLTPEMLDAAELEKGVAAVTGGAYWSYEEEVSGAGGHYLHGGVDGVIGVMPFGCGPDSLMMDMVRRRAAVMKDTPFMCLTLEEHTAEAGIITRLEAFLDMVRRRKRRAVPLCA